MDIVSHGLWGGAAFGRKSKKSFWLAFALGILPDILSFGIFIISNILGFSERPDWSGRPDPSLIPEYIGTMYNLTHSLVLFLIIFFIVYLVRKKPFWEMGAWGLHILFDIPSHSREFFATPFLWPVSDFKINGIPWGNPIVFFPNLMGLVLIYAFWFFRRKFSEK